MSRRRIRTTRTRSCDDPYLWHPLAPRMPRGRTSQEELAQGYRTWTAQRFFVIIDDEQIMAGWSAGAAMFQDKVPAHAGLTEISRPCPGDRPAPDCGAAHALGAGAVFSDCGPAHRQSVPALIMDGDHWTAS